MIDTNELEVKLKLCTSFIVKEVIALDPLARRQWLFTYKGKENLLSVSLVLQKYRGYKNLNFHTLLNNRNLSGVPFIKTSKV